MALCRQGKQGWDATLREAMNGLFGSRAEELVATGPAVEAGGARQLPERFEEQCYLTSNASEALPCSEPATTLSLK